MTPHQLESLSKEGLIALKAIEEMLAGAEAEAWSSGCHGVQMRTSAQIDE